MPPRLRAHAELFCETLRKTTANVMANVQNCCADGRSLGLSYAARFCARRIGSEPPESLNGVPHG